MLRYLANPDQVKVAHEDSPAVVHEATIHFLTNER